MRDEAGALTREAAQRRTMAGGAETKPGLDIQRKVDLEGQDEGLDIQREAYLEMQKAEKRLQRALKREADLEEQAIDRYAELEERDVIRAIDQEAERDLQRWLKWYREVGIHRDFARDYARYVSRMSC